MPTTIADIPGIDQQISNQNNQAAQYQDKLNASPTALGGDGAPTPYDISNQESLQRIQNSIQSLTDQKKKTQWYGSDSNANSDAEVAPPAEGILATGLDYLQRPLRGVVGAVKHVIGQGQGNLFQDVADNMTTNKSTFGDVLKTSGVPWAVSAPLGFALDIGMDPVNWLTMGSEAMVPRLFEGAYKGLTSGEGVVEGISSAAKSGLMGKATTVGRFVPWLKDTEAFANFGEASLKATDAFESITGNTAERAVIKGANYRNAWKGVIDKVANTIPGGNTFLENFVGSGPAGWAKDAKMKDIIEGSLGTGVDTGAAIAAKLKGEPIEPFMKQAGETVAGKIQSAPGELGILSPKDPFAIDMDRDALATGGKERDQFLAGLRSVGLDKKFMEGAPTIVNGVDDATSIMSKPEIYVSADPYENLKRVSEKLGDPGITLQDIERVQKTGALGETGTAWYDNMMKGIRDFGSKVDANGKKIPGIGAAVMDKYDQSLGIFRAFKVGAAPTAMTNAIVGETAMTHMIGSLNPTFMGRLAQAQKVVFNMSDQAAMLDGMYMNMGKIVYGDQHAIQNGILEYPTLSRGLFGDTRFVGSSANAEILLQHARDAGLAGADMKAEDLAPQLQAALDKLGQVKMEGGTGQLKDALSNAVKAGQEGVINPLNAGTEMVANDMFSASATRRMLNAVAENAKADPSNPAWKFLDFTLNNMPSNYSKVHQGFKLGLFNYAVLDGVSKSELIKYSRFLDINPEDFKQLAVDANGKVVKAVDGVVKGGVQYKYFLTPDSALSLTNAAYINYSAMPAAIKVLRNFPLVGSPFISFSYAMALKTGQTLAYNPAAFNKISFALSEFGGTKTPLEKKALSGPIYNYLNQPGMYRVPFFDQNPIYIDLAKMIPYYSLQMFDPSSTQYTGNTWGEKLSQTVQASPFNKNPFGANLFNYIVQPLILGDAIQPQGEFGEPLYPVDANGIQKVGYGARSLAEAFMPNIASYAGLLTPEAAADYIPNYRWRQLSYAKNGKNQLGISSKEPAVSRTIRSILQTTGIPVEAPVNTTFNQKSQTP